MTPRKRYVRTHGYSGYSNGCRCDTCKTAKAEYMRAARAAGRTLRGNPPIERHGIYGYQTYGCRCDVCRAAKAAASDRETRRAQP